MVASRPNPARAAAAAAATLAPEHAAAATPATSETAARPPAPPTAARGLVACAPSPVPTPVPADPTPNPNPTSDLAATLTCAANPAGIAAPSDATARSERALVRVLGALPRVDTGPPNRRTGMARLTSGLDGIEGALDVEEERAARRATLLVNARVDNLSRQSDILAEVVLTASGTETTEEGQPIACRELQQLLCCKTVGGAMTTAFYLMAMCMAWRVCLQVRPSVPSELAAGFFFLSDLRELARRAFGFRLRIETSGRLTPVHLRIYAKRGIDFFAIVDQARLRGVERRAKGQVRKYKLCSYFYPRVRQEAQQTAGAAVPVLLFADAAAPPAGFSAAAGASCSSGSHAMAASGSREASPPAQSAREAADDDAAPAGLAPAALAPAALAPAAAGVAGGAASAAQLLGNLELPPAGAMRIGDYQVADLLEHLTLDAPDNAEGLARKRAALAADEDDRGSAQRRQRTDDESALDGSDGGCADGDDGDGSGDADADDGNPVAAAAPLVRPPATHADAFVAVTTRPMPQGPNTSNNESNSNKNNATRRRAAARASRAAAAAAAATARPIARSPLAVAPVALATPSTAAVIKHLSGEDLRELEDWARPMALATGGPLFGAHISPAGCVELAAPSASFLPRLRAALSSAGRLLLDVGGHRAWNANSAQVGSSALFNLGLGEMFSTVARSEHRPLGDGDESSASRPAAAAAAATTAVPFADDYSGASRVLVVWLDPARLREGESSRLAGGDRPAPFELTLSEGGGGGGIAIPIEHGAVLVMSGGEGPSIAGGGGGPSGGGAPLFAVGPSSSSLASVRGGCDGPTQGRSLVELRFYISDQVAQHCMAAGEVAVRTEAADSVRALLQMLPMP